MNANERRLLFLLLTVGAAIVLIKYVYPATVKSAIDLPKQVAKAQKEHQSLQRARNRLEVELKTKYQDYVMRTGGVDVISVEQYLLDRVFDLIQKSHLREPGINPKSVSTDKKSGVQTVTVTLRAKGRFRDCIEFVRGFYELPYVARLDDLKITPTEARGQVNHDEATLSGEIQVLVLPMEARFGPPDDPQPETVKKYANAPQAYQDLASAKPFTPFFERPTPPPTPSPGPTVVDRGPTPTPIPQLPRDPDGPDTVVRMLMKYGIDEVRLVNTKTQQAHYVTLGEELDGGELVMVHVRGAVVHKETPKKDFGYYVYPKGSRLTEAVPLEQATSEPEILLAMHEYFQTHPTALSDSMRDEYDDSLSSGGGDVIPNDQPISIQNEKILDDQPPQGDAMDPPLTGDPGDLGSNSIPAQSSLNQPGAGEVDRRRSVLPGPNVDQDRTRPTSDSWMRKGESKADENKPQRIYRSGVGNGSRRSVDPKDRINKPTRKTPKPGRPND